ncbi:TIGR01906 family membrane protein [Clostridium culturomicium]|uniref:TIGR01906 family membrane protein n=1 Tax=Clostridium culturomicium TaxID=1499683 RepID=UPI00058BFCD0|nr:TIGR01906 family membrane protein [Clostridium culturomicium]
MRKNILSIFIVIGSLVLALLISTLVVTNSKYIYYSTIEKFELEDRGEVTKEEIKSNYSYIVDYILSKDKSKEFKLPTMEYSKDGAVHFFEVRKLFDLAKIVAIVLLLGVGFLVGIYYYSYKSWKPLKQIGLTLIIMPIATSLVVSTSFSFFFTVFHKIFFNNDKWLFDPLTDPIIGILPEEFFALCAAVIVLLTTIIGLIILICYKRFLSNIEGKESRNISIAN